MSHNEGKPKDKWDKAAVVGQILSGVLLALIALLIKTGTESINNSLKRGELVQSLISDLAAEGEKNIRQDVALIALNRSIGDDQKDLMIEIAEQVVKNRQYENLAGSVAYRILQQRSPEKAREIHQRALDLAASPSVREALRSNADPAAMQGTPTPTPVALPPRTSPPVQQTPLAMSSENQLIGKVLPQIVLVQFREERSRALAEALRKELTEKGFIAPGVDRVDGGYKNSVRYFHEGDGALAERVADLTKTFFAARNANMDFPAQNLSKSRFTVQPGQIEIWISL